jgi:sulfoxide reductase catalytic subunit YedY
MLIKQSKLLTENDVTPEAIYLARRDFFKSAVGISGVALTSSLLAAPGHVADVDLPAPAWLKQKISSAKSDSRKINETLTPYEHVTGHNNFYEFGYEKTDPAEKSHKFKPFPWSVNISGEVNKPGDYPLEDLLSKMQLEERIYRLRCVEAWSMVIPWIGFPLADLIKILEPKSTAKYVSFITVERPKEMPGQASAFSSIDWPYREGLRLDEAMNPLSLMAVGLYGKVLPNQNGAPLRLVVPWKYGFKSIKSIVKIEFTEKQPKTTWNLLAPDEYGFYANVNPTVDHPRWSQARERRLPSGLLSPNTIDTKMFNGYADEVAHLYKDMDLKKFY